MKKKKIMSPGENIIIYINKNVKTIFEEEHEILSNLEQHIL